MWLGHGHCLFPLSFQLKLLSILVFFFIPKLFENCRGFPRIVNFYPKAMNWQNFLNQKLTGQAVGTKLFFLKKRNHVFNDLVFGVSSKVGLSCI